MDKRFCFLLFTILWLPVLLFAAEGRVTGTVHDGQDNTPLAGVNVQVVGTNVGTSTDFEGDYTLALEEGTYTLRFSYIGYAEKEISEVVIAGGGATELDVTLELANDELAEVVVTVSAQRNTEISL